MNRNRAIQREPIWPRIKPFLTVFDPVLSTILLSLVVFALITQYSEPPSTSSSSAQAKAGESPAQLSKLAADAGYDLSPIRPMLDALSGRTD